MAVTTMSYSATWYARHALMNAYKENITHLVKYRNLFGRESKSSPEQMVPQAEAIAALTKALKNDV